MSEMTKERKALMEIVEDILNENNKKEMEFMTEVGGSAYSINHITDWGYGYKSGIEFAQRVLLFRLRENNIGDFEEIGKVATFTQTRFKEYPEEKSAKQADVEGSYTG